MRTRVWMMAALVAACGTAPPRQMPDLRVEIADAWSRSDSAAAVQGGNWWERLGDPELADLVERSLSHNLDLKAAAARLRAAQGQAKIAGAPLWPQVSAGGTGAKRKQIFVGFPIPGAADGGPSSSTSTSYGVSLDVSWELDLWGRLSAGRAAGVADHQAAQATYAGAKLSLAAQTAKAWFALVEAQRQYDLSQVTVENYETTLAQVEDRYNRGIRPSLDLRLTRTDLARARDLRHQRHLLLRRSKRQIEIILGRYPEGEFTSGTTLPTLTEGVPAGIPSDVLVRRPDLVAAERRLAAGAFRHKAALRSRYPRISLTGSSGRTSDSLSDLTDGNFTVWSFAANLLQPLFQGGRIQGNINLTKALEDEALVSYVGSVLRAFAEVEDALTTESVLADREFELGIASTESFAARSLSEDRYRRGLTDLITMLSAQRTAYLTESQLLSVRRQRLDARIDLHLALGGDFQNRNDILVAAHEDVNAGESTR